MGNGPSVVVIGGGAAGMMAALVAARAGACVTLVEANDRVGKKLLATGNGRCNLTNVAAVPANYHGASPAFVSRVLDGFPVSRTLAFFDGLGVSPVTEEQGRVFPRSRQASAVLDCLRWAIEESGVDLRCGAEVVSIRAGRDGLHVALANGQELAADRAILATGGKAAPATGARGGGYALARALGHSIREPFPALVPLELAGRHLKALAGVRVQGRATVLVDGRPADTADGEILFADYGASGPAVMAVSRAAAQVLAADSNRAGFARTGGPGAGRVALSLDLLPDVASPAVAAQIVQRFAAHPGRSLLACLVGFLHKRLAAAILKAAGVDPESPASEARPDLANHVAATLADWRFEVIGTTGWAAAQVTAGGVDTGEVDPATLASRRCPGLFLVGEVLDVDGDCGGFNLQWAWSTGALAGAAAAGTGPESLPG